MILCAEERAVIRKAAGRLLPFLALLYFVAFLDRVNVSFAALTMNADIGLSASAYGLGAGIFFVSYVLFEIPSNLALQRFGARRWITRIMITWGLLSVAMAFVTGPYSFFVLRFLIGAAEAGFFPGIILYLTYWFPAKVRGQMIGMFFAAVPLSNVIGAPLSSWLLSKSIWGLSGWQTMFVLEGIPAIVLGALVFFWLADEPLRASWLTPQERELLHRAVRRDQPVQEQATLRDGLTSSKVWLLALIYFFLVVGLYGFGFWAPQMLSASHPGLTRMQIGLAIALPYAVACIAMYAWTRHSDRSRERRWHVAAPAFIGAGGFLATTLDPGFPLMLVAYAAIASGIYAAAPVFWTLPAAALSGAAAAGGIALVNSVGNVAGYVGAFAIGWLLDRTGRYDEGLWVMGASMACVGLLMMALPRQSLQAGSAQPE